MLITRKLVISNVVFSSGGLLITQLINLFILPLFIKNIGAEMYGLWVISGLLLGYLDSFDFGLSAGLQKYVAEAYVKRNHEEFNRTISTGVGMLLLIGLLFGSSILIFKEPLLDLFNVSPEHRLDAGQVLIMTGIASVAIWPLRIGGNILTGTMYINQLSVAGAIHHIAASVLMLIMVIVVKNVVWVLAGTLVLRLIFRWITILMSFRYHPHLRIIPKLFSFGKLKEMSGFSLNMFWFNLLGMMSQRMHPIFISAILSPASVIYYTVATKIWDLINRYTSMLNQTVIPTAFNLSATTDTRRIEMLVERGVRYRTILAAPMAMICLAASPAFIKLWMGPEYLSSAGWSQLLSVVILITPLAIAQHVARGCGKPGPINIIFTVRVLFNLAVTITLMPRLGAGASVLGIAASQIFLGEGIFFFFYCRLCGIQSRKIFLDYLKITGTVLPFGLFGLWIATCTPPSSLLAFLIFCGALAAAQYLTLMLLFFSHTERKDILLAAESVGLSRIVDKMKGLRK